MIAFVKFLKSRLDLYILLVYFYRCFFEKMPRPRILAEPVIINYVKSKKTSVQLEFATTNEDKLREIRRILPDFTVVGLPLIIDEIQSSDPIEVVRKKAIEAYEKNDYNPIIVEDTSLFIPALENLLPQTFDKFFTATSSSRQTICNILTTLGDDRRALAKVYFAAYDGKDVHIREGVTSGKITLQPRGTNGFGWDDIFIPDGQRYNGHSKTFAEMHDNEKDKFSMRNKALEELRKKPITNGRYMHKIPEPFVNELERLRLKELQESKAIKFSYALESIKDSGNSPATSFRADKYTPIIEDDGIFYSRYTINPKSPSLGLILTDVERANIKLDKKGHPIFWQIGPERRTLALAQRAEFFLKNHIGELRSIFKKIDTGQITIPKRSNKRHTAVEEAMELKNGETTFAPSFSDFGYKKRSSTFYQSRSITASHGLFNKIGKYPRKLIGVGSLVPVSGNLDIVVTAAINNMIVFIPRNSLFVDYKRRIKLINKAKEVIRSIGLTKELVKISERNIGVALGTVNPKKELEIAKAIYKNTGQALFRIYTINSDPRVIETALLIRQYFGNKAEIFAGQIADIKQARKLIAPNIKVDGLIFGHGAGRQCTSAKGGMAVTLVEDLYKTTIDPTFNDTTLLVEGGVGEFPSIPLIFGADGILYNQQLVHGTIEAGDFFVVHKKTGEFVQPYPGSASPVTQIIESADPELRLRRVNPGGRTKYPEGKPGFMFYEEKANSMVFYIQQFESYIARALVDLGTTTFQEFRQFLLDRDESEQILKRVTQETAELAEAYRNTRS